MKKRFFIALLLGLLLPGVATERALAAPFEPDTYTITIYEIGLFRSAPNTPNETDGVDFSDSVAIYQSSAGDEVTVIKGSPTTLNGTITRPPDGTYTHGYVIMKPEIKLKGSDGTVYSKAATNSLLSTTGYTANTGAAPAAETTWVMNCVGVDGTTPEFSSSISGGNVYLLDMVSHTLPATLPDSPLTTHRIVGIIALNATIDNTVTGADYRFDVTNGANVATVAVPTGANPGATGSIMFPGNIVIDARLLQ